MVPSSQESCQLMARSPEDGAQALSPEGHRVLCSDKSSLRYDSIGQAGYCQEQQMTVKRINTSGQEEPAAGSPQELG